MTDKPCPCRAKDPEPLPYAQCCAPILEAGKPAPTAEALMRARYSAFALGKIDFLYDSLAPESRHDFDRKAVQHWSSQSQWLGLEILSTEGGMAGDKEGYVEFVAHFSLEGKEQAHRERSKFREDETNGWYFLEEANRKPEPVVKGRQPGRNDPCPCGSGKKYKKCCALAA
jgi:SEC-C motif domain protein